MSLTSNTLVHVNTMEFGKFGELGNDSRFPNMSSLRIHYRDNGAPLSATDEYRKYAQLTYTVNEGSSTSANWDTFTITVPTTAAVAGPNIPATTIKFWSDSATIVILKTSGSGAQVNTIPNKWTTLTLTQSLSEIKWQSGDVVRQQTILYSN